MKNHFKVLLSMAFLLGWAAVSVSNAWAYTGSEDISCWDGDCLGKGWTAQDRGDNTFTDFSCYRDGCELSGWIAGGTQGAYYYTQCKGTGCFKEGWYEIDRQTQNLIRQTVCGEKDGVQDCLKYGWASYSPNERHFTSCMKEDCRKNGWSSNGPWGRTYIATCKKGGCFTEGWIESRY